jgi:hypothetical protein
VNNQHHVPAALSLAEGPQYSSDRKFGGFQSQSGGCKKNLSLTEPLSPTVLQSVAYTILTALLARKRPFVLILQGTQQSFQQPFLVAENSVTTGKLFQKTEQGVMGLSDMSPYPRNELPSLWTLQIWHHQMSLHWVRHLTVRLIIGAEQGFKHKAENFEPKASHRWFSLVNKLSILLRIKHTTNTISFSQ